MTLAFTLYVPWVPTTMATVQDRLPQVLERAEATPNSHGDRQQGSGEPRSEQSIFHQRRAYLSGERAPGVERRLTEVLLDDKRPDRQDRDRPREGDRHGRWSFSLKMRTPRSRRRPPHHEPVSACGSGPDRAGGRRFAHAAGHSRFARSAARSRKATAGAAGVGRLWPTTRGRSDDGCHASRIMIVVVLVCLVGGACQLKRPETTPGRMIEPQLLAPRRHRPPRRARAERPRPRSGCSIRKRDTLAAGASPTT